MQIKQRDNEIGILLNYLNKKKERGEDVEGMPVSRDTSSTGMTSAKKEEIKDYNAPARGQGTLYQ